MMTKRIISSLLTLIQLIVIINNPLTLCRSWSKQGSTLSMNECRPHLHDKHDSSKISCECTEDYCDNLVFDLPISGHFLKVVSSKSGRRFSVYRSAYKSSNDYLGDDDHEYDSDGDRNKNTYNITLDFSEQYQTILGWGGAFTDASLINIDKLSKKLSKVLIENYYGEYGLQYNFGRVPIAGTDFSNHTYSYNDVEEPDYEQKYWSLADEDTKLKIPYLKLAKQLVERRNSNLKLFASSWSPPSWMKTNHKFIRGFLQGPSSVEGKTYGAYAKYLLNFLEAYKKNDLSMWGMTVQNEPGSAFLPFYYFNSLQFSPQEQIDFINYHLGPQLEQHGYNKSNFKLIIGDDSLGIVNILVDQILDDVSVRKFVSGLAIHWYLSGSIPYSYIDRLYANHKDQVEFMLMTEACFGSMPYEQKVVLGDWSRGVSYAKDIIEDVNRNVNGWIDWNLALDLKGGPNWAGNNVDSPIIVDHSNDKFYKNPMYYVLGHFSRFIPPGSKRIQLSIDNIKQDSIRMDDYDDLLKGFGAHPIKATAFLLPSKKHISLVLLNLSNNSEKVRIELTGHTDDHSTTPLNIELDPDSITTLVQGIRDQ